MKVEIVYAETIRPSSPTPDHLKCFTLSFFDQLSPPMYAPLILFYSGGGGILDGLRTSLSETLTRFFPFAGRIKDDNNISVDCTDEGIEYTEARVRGSNLQDILAPPKLELLGQLLPTECGFSKEARADKLLLVQASVFECGGMAIGICFSHKLADAATINFFIKSWTASARGSSSHVVAPDLSLGSQFPPSDAFATSSPTDQLLGSTIHKSTSRRFVFSGSKMATLKAKSSSQSVSYPTRVEVVSSLIWRCAMRSALSVKSNPKSYGLLQTVDLRKRVDPPLPDSCFGNFVSVYTVRADKADPMEDLPTLVAKIRGAKEEYMEDYPKKLRMGQDSLSKTCENLERVGELVKEEGMRTYTLSRWSNFELYEADFGWGKPIWTSMYHDSQGRNTVVLMDARDGEGIEAWLSLPEEEMVVFEQDKEFLLFASPNPSIIVFHPSRI